MLAAQSPLIALQLPLFRLGLGAHLGSGRQWMSWISLEDEVDAIIHAALTPTIEGPCNLVSPEPVRNVDFAEAFARAVGRRSCFGVPRRSSTSRSGREATKEIATRQPARRSGQALGTGFVYSCETISQALGARRRRALAVDQ